MNTNKKHTTTALNSRTRFFGAMLTVALMAHTAFATGPTTVNLGTAGTFRILAKTGISATAGTAITGNIGVSPAAASTVTGFGLIMDPSGTFATSSMVVGNVYAADYTEPTPTNLTTAVLDMQAAYTDAAGRPTPDFTNVGTAGDITGQTLVPGLYNWTTGVSVGAGGVTISGSATDTWIFQIAGTLGLANGAAVTLGGAAKASNIFWQVAGQVTLGTTAVMKGIILGQTAIVMQTGAALDGRALAQTAVTLDAVTALPVEIVSFTATANRANADLHWSTATEINNHGFEIERRQTAAWNKVGFVSGAGTSNAPRDYSYTDNNLAPGRYTYRLKQVDNDGVFSYHGSIEVVIAASAPQEFALSQNYPNPFNPSTVISYQIPVSSKVTLKVYDILGNEVATLINGEMEAGSYTVPFSAITGSTLASGMYIYRLQAGSFVATKKLVLMK